MTDPSHRHGPDVLNAKRYQHLAYGDRVALQAQATLVHIVQTECDRVDLAASTWWDTRPMLDGREHRAALLDVNAELLAMALAMQLVARHPHPALQHLVCVLFAPEV